MDPISDMIPTAGTSAAAEEEETMPKPESLVETVPEAVDNSSTTSTSATSSSSSITRNKRRSQDEMANTPSTKKPRRMSKMRGKRAKV